MTYGAGKRNSGVDREKLPNTYGNTTIETCSRSEANSPILGHRKQRGPRRHVGDSTHSRHPTLSRQSRVSFRRSKRLEQLLRRAFSAPYYIGSFLDLNEIKQAWALYRDRYGISAQNHQEDSEGGQVK